MLEVHPPHHAANTWRDFFIHIATIVVGLLIAVGLEQTVEHFHLLHSMSEAREHIRREVEVNQRVFNKDEGEMTLLMDRMQRNLELVQGGGTAQVAGTAFDFSWNLQNFFDAAYSGAKDSGALSRMPYDEAASYEDAYTGVTMSTEAMLELIKEIYAAKALVHGRPASALSSTERTALESLLESVLGKAEYYKLILELEHQSWDEILAGHFRTDIGGSGK